MLRHFQIAMRTSRGLQFVIAMMALLVWVSNADYQIGFIVQSVNFLEPLNTLADGSCCDSGCNNSSCCAATNITCAPTLRLCFRRSQHPTDDNDSPCLEMITRTNGDRPFISLGKDNQPIQIYYTGRFQAYTRISHLEGQVPDFDAPFTDPLIDEVFMEFNTTAVLFEDQLLSPMPEQLTASGTNDRVQLSLQVMVNCALGWNGSACEMFCDVNDTCTQVYDGPFVNLTFEPTTVNMTSENSTVNLTSETVTAATSTESVLAIQVAVGVPVGVVSAVVLFLLLVAFACCVKEAKQREKVNIEVVGNESGHGLSAFYSETGVNDYEIRAMEARLAVITYMGNFNSTTSSELNYITY